MIEQQVGATDPLMIIIVEPGLGYLLPALRKRHPQATLIAVHFVAELRTLCQWSADYHWTETAGEESKIEMELEEFLFACIEQLPSPRVAAIIPSYVKDIAPQRLEQFKRVISGTIQTIRSNLATVGHFGKRWINNSIANTLFVERIIRPVAFPTNCPVCIVGSGPTLNEMIAVLAEAQQHALILALPSALPCLDTHGIAVDMVVNTDGGFWATAHFHARQRRGTTPPIAMPLTAASPIAHCRIAFDDNTIVGDSVALISPPILLFNQQFCLESELAALVDPQLPIISEHGTVAASAVELAVLLQAERILLFGIDGAYVNAALHCWPHSFERYYFRQLALTQSSEQEVFTRLLQTPPAATKRSGLSLRISRAHTVYRQELRALARQTATPLHAVTPLPRNDIGIPAIDGHTAIDELCSGGERTASATEAIARLRSNDSQPDAQSADTQHRPQSEKRIAIIALLRSYQQRIKVASDRHTESSERTLQTLMHALAPQQFHTAWKTRTADDWSTLRTQCIDALQNLTERYR